MNCFADLVLKSGQTTNVSKTVANYEIMGEQSNTKQ